MPNPTAGPWIETDEFLNAGFAVARNAARQLAVSDEEVESNARLITAAPDLLAVMRDVAAMLPVAARLHPNDLFALQTRVCAAIAKATGDAL